MTNISTSVSGGASFLHPFSQERSLAASLIQLKKLGYNLGQKVYTGLFQLEVKPKCYKIPKQWSQRWSFHPFLLEVGIAKTEQLDLATNDWQNLAGAQMEVAR